MIVTVCLGVGPQCAQCRERRSGVASLVKDLNDRTTVVAGSGFERRVVLAGVPLVCRLAGLALRRRLSAQGTPPSGTLAVPSPAAHCKAGEVAATGGGVRNARRCRAAASGKVPRNRLLEAMLGPALQRALRDSPFLGVRWIISR